MNYRLGSVKIRFKFRNVNCRLTNINCRPTNVNSMVEILICGLTTVNERLRVGDGGGEIRECVMRIPSYKLL